MPAIDRRDDLHPDARRRARPDRRRFVAAALLVARADAARPPGRRSASTSSTARRRAGSTRHRSRAAVASRSPRRSSWSAASSCCVNGRPIDAGPVAARRPADLVALLLVGGAAAAAIGAIDDLLDLRARWQLAGQIALGALRRRARDHRSASSPTRSAAASIRFEGAFAIGFHGLLDRRDDQQHQLHRRPRRAVVRDRAHRRGHAGDDQPDDRRRPAAHRRPVLHAGRVRCSGSCAGTSTRPRSSSGPAASSSSGYTLAAAGHPRARPRSRSRCSSSASRSSIPSGSSSGACRRVDRRSARIGATSTTACSISGCRTARRSSSSTGSASRSRVLALALSGVEPAVRVPRRLPRLRAGPVHPDARRAPTSRGARGRLLRARSARRRERRADGLSASRRSGDSRQQVRRTGAVRCGTGRWATRGGGASIGLTYHRSGLPWYYPRTSLSLQTYLLVAMSVLIAASLLLLLARGISRYDARRRCAVAGARTVGLGRAGHRSRPSPACADRAP